MFNRVHRTASAGIYGVSLHSFMKIFSGSKTLFASLILLGSYFVFFWLTYPEFLYLKFGRHIPSLILAWFILDAVHRLRLALHSASAPTGRIYQRSSWGSSGWWFFAGAFVLLFLSLAFNLSMLFQRWTDGLGGWSIAGLLPWNDASGYLMGSISMIELGHLDPWTARRPLGTLFYSVLMKITGQNLMQTYLLTTICVSFSFWSLAVSVFRTHGFSASLLVLSLVSSYFGPYNGLYITEAPGLMLGSISIGLMWIGFRFKKIHYALLGLFTFGLALSVRAGAFFTLPLIILYTGWRFRSKKAFDLKILVIAGLTSALSLGFSPLHLKMVGPTDYSYQGNFAYTLYSLSKGGRIWSAVEEDHPELFLENLSEEALVDKIYEYSFEEIRRNPRGFITAVVNIWFDAFRYPANFFFPFHSGFNTKTFLALSCLALVSLLLLHSPRDRPIVLFLFLSLLGIVLSSPFLRLYPSPFLNIITARVYAASIPFNCLAFAIGLGIFLDWVSRITLKKRPALEGLDVDESELSRLAGFEKSSFFLAIVFIFLIVVMPLYVKLSRPELSFDIEGFGCGDDVRLICRLTRGSYLEIGGDREKNIIPKVGITSYRKYNPSRAGGPIQFGELRPGMFLTVGLNFLDPEEIAYIVFNEDIGKYDGKLVAICGTRIASSSPHHLYHGSVLKVINN